MQRNGRDIATVFTDASFCQKHLVSGFSVWAKSGEGSSGVTFGGYYIGTPCVNTAELLAAMSGIKLCLKEGIILRGNHVVLKTDSMHVVNVLNGLLKVNCPIHAQVRYSLGNVLSKADLILEAQHVRGHQKDNRPRSWVNNKCDEIAKHHLKIARDIILNK